MSLLTRIKHSGVIKVLLPDQPYLYQYTEIYLGSNKTRGLIFETGSSSLVAAAWVKDIREVGVGDGVGETIRTLKLVPI